MKININTKIFISISSTPGNIGANFYSQSTECALSGDINNDNLINILDVILLINIILEVD